MNLQGQGGRSGERGYTMAALLVALGVMAVLMSAALPAWRHQTRREREAELAFRGEQYVRAIALWERKMGPGSRPPNFDILVDQKFLRKKYKDPITGGEFLPVMLGMPAQGGQQPGGGRGGGGTAPGLQTGTPVQPAQEGVLGSALGQPTPGPGIAGGIVGVRSRSTEPSIRIYKGATRYSDWRFDHAGASLTPGGDGVARPGGRGQPNPGAPGAGRGRGGRGISPPPGQGPGRIGLPPPGARGRGPGQ